MKTTTLFTVEWNDLSKDAQKVILDSMQERIKEELKNEVIELRENNSDAVNDKGVSYSKMTWEEIIIDTYEGFKDMKTFDETIRKKAEKRMEKWEGIKITL
jgi:TRAP-type C4-dicarboxylate transport system substrate-binding protein